MEIIFDELEAAKSKLEEAKQPLSDSKMIVVDIDFPEDFEGMGKILAAGGKIANIEYSIIEAQSAIQRTIDNFMEAIRKNNAVIAEYLENRILYGDSLSRLSEKDRIALFEQINELINKLIDNADTKAIEVSKESRLEYVYYSVISQQLLRDEKKYRTGCAEVGVDVANFTSLTQEEYEEYREMYKNRGKLTEVYANKDISKEGFYREYMTQNGLLEFKDFKQIPNAPYANEKYDNANKYNLNYTIAENRMWNNCCSYNYECSL